MTNKDIYHFWREAANYSDPDAFASDAAISLLDPENPDQEVDMDLFKRVLWHVANDQFRAFLKLLGLSQSQCSVRFCIPLRTVQGWATGERVPPPYIRLMMAECVGIIKRQ